MKYTIMSMCMVALFFLTSCSEDQWTKHDLEQENVISLTNIEDITTLTSIDFYESVPMIILDKISYLSLAEKETLLAKEDNSTASEYIFDFVTIEKNDTCNYHCEANKQTLKGQLICVTKSNDSSKNGEVESPFEISLIQKAYSPSEDEENVSPTIAYDGIQHVRFIPLSEEVISTPYTNSDEWVKNEAASLEFDTDIADNNSIWQKVTSGWSSWAFDAKNTTVDDGKLVLNMTYAPDTVTYTQKGKEKEYNYVSGMLNTKQGQYFTYGYFEARIKGTSKFPGTCPAFWLWSNDSVRAANKGVEGKSCYNEIDVVEMEQVQSNINMLECNLHAMMTEGGVEYYKRPRTDNGKWADICQNQVVMDWDPRDDYHTYAVENRPDSIFWFVDDVLIAKKENIYWHLPMQVTLSLGLRPPYEYYDEDGIRHPDFPNGTSDGFPTDMKVDYIRIWKMKE